MLELIEKLREKPDHVKRQVAFCVAFFFAGLIFVIWLSVIYPDLKQNQVTEEKVTNLEPSPFSTFISTASSGFGGISAEFSKIKNTLSSFSTSPAYYSTSTGR